MFNTQLLQNLQKYTRAPIAPHYQNNAKNWDWGRIEEEAHTVCDQWSNVLLTADGGAGFHVLIRLVCDITCNTISNIMLGLKKYHKMRTHAFHITRCLHHEQHWSSSTVSPRAWLILRLLDRSVILLVTEPRAKLASGPLSCQTAQHLSPVRTGAHITRAATISWLVTSLD